MDTSEEFIPVGEIAGVFGIKGWMKVFSHTDPRKNILSYSPLYLSLKGEWVEAKISKGRVQGKGIVIALENVTDPEQVLPLIGNITFGKLNFSLELLPAHNKTILILIVI